MHPKQGCCSFPAGPRPALKRPINLPDTTQFTKPRAFVSLRGLILVRSMNRPESHESGVAVCRIADIAGQWTRAQAPPKLDLPCSHPSSTAGTPAAQASALGPLLTRGSTRWFDATNETPRGDSPPAASHQVSSPPGPCQSRPAEHPALRALRKGKLAFAFSGGGWLFPYHLGWALQHSHPAPDAHTQKNPPTHNLNTHGPCFTPM